MSLGLCLGLPWWPIYLHSHNQIGWWDSTETECKRSKLQHSVTATKLTKTLFIYVHKFKSGQAGEKAPLCNFPTTVRTSLLKLMLLMTQHVTAPGLRQGSETTCSNAGRLEAWEPPYNHSICPFEAGSEWKTSCQLVFPCTQWSAGGVGGLMRRIFPLWSLEESKMKRGEARGARSIPPTPVKAYVFGIEKIDNLDELCDCLLLSGKKKNKVRKKRGREVEATLSRLFKWFSRAWCYWKHTTQALKRHPDFSGLMTW